MGDAKLLRCISELENGGDAHRRCVQRGADPFIHLGIARSLAIQRGLRTMQNL